MSEGFLDDDFGSGSNTNTNTNDAWLGASTLTRIAVASPFLLVGAYVLAMAIFFPIFAYSNMSGGVQDVWHNVHELQRQQRNDTRWITRIVSWLLPCGSHCDNGNFTADSFRTNSSLFAPNGSSGTFDVVRTVLDQQQQIADLITVVLYQQELIDNITALVDGRYIAKARRELNEFLPVSSILPDTDIVPFPVDGFYGYVEDANHVFTFTPNYTRVNRDAVVWITANIYFSSDNLGAVLACFIMQNTSLVPGTYPTVVSGGGQSFNTSAFQFVNASGLATLTGSYRATAGDTLAVRCGISEPDPLFYFVSSQISFSASLIGY